MIEAKIIADSQGTNSFGDPSLGTRITTFECKYPRFIHSEFMTHRALSKNSASSRAIPLKKMIQAVLDEPAMPEHWGAEQKGMQSGESLDGMALHYCKQCWLSARDHAVHYATEMANAGLHKSLCNRILEPWAHMTIIVTGTEWNNFFNLRCHKDAQPEFQVLAKKMLRLYKNNVPESKHIGEWHLPMVSKEELAQHGIEICKKISTGRCARVSYLTHDGVRDIQADWMLHDRLVIREDDTEPKHMSPTEHPAMCNGLQRSGNYIGWTPYRKFIPNENMTALNPVVE